MVKPSVFTKVVIIWSCLLIAGESRGQGIFSRKNIINQYTTVGIGGGSSHYWGDLSPYTHFYNALYTNVRWNGHINYTRFLTPDAGIRLQLSWVRLFGDDFTYSQRNLDLLWHNYIRNLHFRNDVKEMALNGIFNLLPSNGEGARRRLAFTPYATVGLGLIVHSPKATMPVSLTRPITNRPDWESLRNAYTSGQNIPATGLTMYSTVEPVLPLGLGLRIKINEKFDITLEGNLRFTKTDYLDDVANVAYADEGILGSFIGSDLADLSYRADEAYHSRTQKDRIPILHQIWSDPSKLNAGPVPIGWLPTDITAHYNPTTPGRVRGNASKVPDTYGTFQLTLSYILSSKIKCPELK